MAALRHPILSRWLFCVCALVCAAAAFPLHNITLPLPLGTTNHGTPGLLCTPTKWTDIALFYLFNYVAHAATVLTRPGERSDDFFASVVGSLLCPTLGLYRGIEAILCGAVFARKDDLRKAARSGALCMVVRGRDWRPLDGDEASNGIFRRRTIEPKETVPEQSCSDADSVTKSNVEDDSSVHLLTYSPPCLGSKFGCPIYVHRQLIHGSYSLPQGYRFVIVPSDTLFAPPSAVNSVIEVSATYNLVRSAIALAQSIYTLLTLYRARGDQIRQFGYAAFGLTVAPYAVMSMVNLVGNLCRPDYASICMVENDVMDEARRRGGVFAGAVGRVVEDEATTCACGLADGDDVEHLRFAVDGTGRANATFGVAAPPEIWDKRSAEKSDSVRSSLALHSHLIKPLPANLNYAGTQDDALLLIPCCTPIKRSSTGPDPDGGPSRYSIQKLRLRKSSPPFKPREWVLTFAPSAITSSTRRWHIAKYALTAVVALTPLAIVGIMSRFQPGSIPHKESSTWKSYTMQWLAFSVVSGLWWVLDQEGKDARQGFKAWLRPSTRVVLYVISSAPAVGGFIVVGQMLSRYGVCVWVGD